MKILQIIQQLGTGGAEKQLNELIENCDKISTHLFSSQG
jgi:hypothetical protein